jgi:acyl carrier protein
VLVFLERELGIWVPDEDLTDEIVRSARTLAAYVCSRQA